VTHTNRLNNIITISEDEIIVEDNTATLKKTEALKRNNMANIFKRFFNPTVYTRRVLFDFFRELFNLNNTRHYRNKRYYNKIIYQPTYI